MRFTCTIKQLPSGAWYARSIGSAAGTVETSGNSREEALDKLRKEIRYRIEFCPCSGVTDHFVELEIREAGSR